MSSAVGNGLVALLEGTGVRYRPMMVRRLTNEDLERRRRSYAMLSPGQAAGMSREEAIELLEELQRCRSRGRQLLEALREIGAAVDRVLRALVTPGRAPGG